VLETLKEKNWKLGGESSGHMICLDKSTTGDGIIAALQVFASMLRQNKTLDELCVNLKLVPQKLFNIKTENALSLAVDKEVLKKVDAITQVLNNTGRVLLRPSGTEPLLRLMIEGQDEVEITKYAEALRDEILEIESKVVKL
jgi:phosphoglucosamine mutase